MMMVLGGSTNSVVHILSLSEELGFGDVVNLDKIAQISKKTPCLVNVKPNGPYHLTDFERSGGMPAAMREVRSCLNTDVMTVTCRTMAENMEIPLKYEPDRRVPL